jgi:hypothetical protein
MPNNLLPTKNLKKIATKNIFINRKQNKIILSVKNIIYKKISSLCITLPSSIPIYNETLYNINRSKEIFYKNACLVKSYL